MASHARSRSLLAITLLTFAALVPGAVGLAPASGTTTVESADAGAGWLARQLVDGDHLEVVFGDTAYPDQGLTIDAVLGFAAAGGSGDAAMAAVTWLGGSATTSGYIGDGITESYAGATAKLALLAQVAGEDPRSFGDDSLDLIARLQALELANGRFADVSAYGDYSNSIGQSLAIIVLVRQGITPSSDAVDLLRLSRCADGGFALELEPDPVTCTSGVDTTAYAVNALYASGDGGDAAAAVEWLVDAQAPSGGFGTNGPDAPNANSTGLAAQALSIGGRAAAAADARTYLRTLQVGCDAPAADRGAFAFDASGFEPSSATRATAQALLGLTGGWLSELTLSGTQPDAATLDCRQATTTTAAPTTVAPTTSSPTTVAPTTTTVVPATPVAATPTYTG